MKGRSVVLIAGLLLCAGCASRTWNCDSPNAIARPGVQLLSVTPTSDSPGRGSTFFPFPAPQYPYEMLRAGVGGEVTVRVTVESDGRVEEAKVVRSSEALFASPAVAAVERWRFFEFLDPGVKEHRKMVLDCQIQFEPVYDEDTDVFRGAIFSQSAPEVASPGLLNLARSECEVQN